MAIHTPFVPQSVPLGEDAGIQEFEKSALTVSFDSIQSEMVKLKTAIAKSAQNEILLLLTEEQKLRIPSLLGKPFELQEEPKQKLVRLASERINGIVPDPDSVFDSCILLKNQSIVDELDVTKEQLSNVARIRKARDFEKKTAVESKLNTMFTPSQKERLKQIVYQLEVARRGFGFAIADGFLGRAIGVSDSQRAELKEKAKALDSKTKAALVVVDEEARKRLLGNLSSAQQKAVTTLLGKPFKRDAY